MLALLESQKKTYVLAMLAMLNTHKLKDFVVLVLLNTFPGVWCGDAGLSETYNCTCFGDAGLAENIQKCMIW